MKRKGPLVCSVTALVVAIGFSAAATEHKTVSLEEAWKLCKQDVDKALPNNSEHQTQRYQRAGACMRKYGYRL